MKSKGMISLFLVLVLVPLNAKGDNKDSALSDNLAEELSALADKYERDSFQLGGKSLDIYSIGHGTLLLVYDKIVIHVDPVSSYADYAEMPAADLILITHEHSDHLDTGAILRLKKEGTVILTNESSAGKLGEGIVMKNGDTRTVLGIEVEAVPAYNTTEGRDKFHPEGRDNGYILTLGGKRVYLAGDSEDTPEMKALKDIYIAFLPMNQPYTMLPAQVAAAAKAFGPEILFPYHFGDTDISELETLMQDVPGVELRIRKLN